MSSELYMRPFLIDNEYYTLVLGYMLGMLMLGVFGRISTQPVIRNFFLIQLYLRESVGSAQCLSKIWPFGSS